ncbi:MAG TPA: histidinol dehydrogenase, partial [Desulfobacterales bacterium]|nr:histidinol dehydrogenase [Desulfobacterales bacterium]
MKILNYPSAAAESAVARIVTRGLSFSKKDHAAVSRILEEVRRRGDQALVKYSRRFDAPGFTLQDLRVGPAEFRQAAAAADRGFTRALNRAATQIEAFHRRQVRNSFISLDRAGTMLGQLVRPVERVGVYVPGGQGGKTPLVSSVLMGAIPARVAGVAQVVMVTPPTADGRVNPHLLVAARKAGVDEVYKAGSAWAVAALAYGTETIPRVDVIVGPGNLYVTLAKKIVAGTVGIDIIAGPSEILVIADESADPEFIAADLLSQAEHDPMASAVLVTTRRELAQAVKAALSRQLAQLARAEIARESIRRFGAAIVVRDVAAAIALANRMAPEHLELQLRDPFAHLGAIRNAGAVFLGEYTPEPVGDYVAGPNHVLPTAGTARFASALSVDNFVKRTSLIHYSADA